MEERAVAHTSNQTRQWSKYFPTDAAVNSPYTPADSAPYSLLPTPYCPVDAAVNSPYSPAEAAVNPHYSPADSALNTP